MKSLPYRDRPALQRPGASSNRRQIMWPEISGAPSQELLPVVTHRYRPQDHHAVHEFLQSEILSMASPDVLVEIVYLSITKMVGRQLWRAGQRPPPHVVGKLLILQGLLPNQSNNFLSAHTLSMNSDIYDGAGDVLELLLQVCQSIQRPTPANIQHQSLAECPPTLDIDAISKESPYLSRVPSCPFELQIVPRNQLMRRDHNVKVMVEVSEEGRELLLGGIGRWGR